MGDRDPAIGNHLVERLSGQARVEFLQSASRVLLGREEEIIHSGQDIKRVFFPISAVCCSLISLRSGQRAEVTTVGSEGFVGIPAILGRTTSPELVVAQIAGEAYAIEGRHLLRLCDNHASVRKSLFDFVGYALQVARQTAACNAYHNIEQRVARWLLTADDRAATEEFHMTHELLTHMVAATRPRVSEAAAKLRSSGVIAYSAGKMLISDRQRLEEMACECYAVIRRSLQTLHESR